MTPLAKSVLQMLNELYFVWSCCTRIMRCDFIVISLNSQDADVYLYTQNGTGAKHSRENGPLGVIQRSWICGQFSTYQANGNTFNNEYRPIIKRGKCGFAVGCWYLDSSFLVEIILNVLISRIELPTWNGCNIFFSSAYTCSWSKQNHSSRWPAPNAITCPK